MDGATAYQQTFDPDSDELFESHAGLIKRIALHLSARLPPHVELEDLMQAGAVGLLEAARRFDPSQGVHFAAYASIRVRGAMLDELRRLDWSPRSTRRKLRRLQHTLRELETELGREPSEREMAYAMDMSLTDYRSLLQDSVTSSVISLDGVPSHRTKGAMAEIGNPDLDPELSADVESQRRVLAGVISTLAEREQQVLSLYYEQQMNLKEIGQVLGVSESRVCQIHGQILNRLRARLDQTAEELA